MVSGRKAGANLKGKVLRGGDGKRKKKVNKKKGAGRDWDGGEDKRDGEGKLERRVGSCEH